jgi:tetraacyldisaccharide-1-P 4'-kinase
MGAIQVSRARQELVRVVLVEAPKRVVHEFILPEGPYRAV